MIQTIVNSLQSAFDVLSNGLSLLPLMTKHEFLEFLEGLREIFKGNINSKPYPICDYKVAFFGPLLFFE